MVAVVNELDYAMGKKGHVAGRQTGGPRPWGGAQRAKSDNSVQKIVMRATMQLKWSNI